MNKDRITPEDIPLLVQLCSGLLASGHFTTPTIPDPNADEGPDLVTFDCGKDWKDDGCDCRFIIEATSAAFRLLDDIKTHAERTNKHRDDLDKEECPPPSVHQLEQKQPTYEN